MSNLGVTIKQPINLNIQKASPGDMLQSVYDPNHHRADAFARANHTGTQLASTISDFNTAVRTNRLDQMAAPTSAVSMNSQRLTNLSSPTLGTDAVNKDYVDAFAQSLDIKQSVRVTTTGNITLSGTQTIDGVALSVGDRVLVKDQSTASQNGIYVVASGAWTRATDADTSADVTTGMYAFVSEGTTNADSAWVLTTNDTITLGSTALAFTQFSGAGQITAGGGMTKTGNTLDVVGTANRIVVNADSIDIGTDVVTLTGSQTLSNKTLTTPTIASFVNANHNHTNAAGGGQLTDAALSAAVSISKGGTGQTGANAGFNALSPMTTQGDLIYGGASGAATRLAIGSGSQVLIGGTSPNWGAVDLTAMVSGTLPIGNGGTGSATKNFVDLSTTQTINGNKTFGSSITGNANDNIFGTYNTGSGGGVDVGSLGTNDGWVDVRSSATNANLQLRPKGTGTINANSARISSVANPTSNQDAATKTYVDTLASTNDALALHKAGAETVTGAKTFNAGMLLDKGSIVIDIATYGAVSDGTTDDTTAVQAALDAAGASGKSAYVRFPDSTTLINTSTVRSGTGTHGLFISSNTTLVGNGWGSVLKQGFANSGTGTTRFLTNADKVNGNANITIAHLRVDVPAITGTSPTMVTYTESMRFFGVTDVKLFDVYFKNGQVVAHVLPPTVNTPTVHTTGNNHRWWVESCYFVDTPEAMAWVHGTDLYFGKNVVVNAFDSSFSVNSSGERMVIVDNVIDKQGNSFGALAHIELTNDQAGDAAGIRDYVIANNVLINGGSTTTKAIQLQYTNNGAVLGNTIRNLQQHGMTVSGSSDVTIGLNSISDILGTNRKGIYVTNDYNSNNGPIAIVGNTIRNTSGDGIGFGGGSYTLGHITVTGNDISGAGGWGINPNAAVTQGLIEANNISGNTSGDIASAGAGWRVISWPLSIANGGTGSATQNFVDLSSAQASIGGAKGFTGAVTVGGLLSVYNKILGTQSSNVLDIQPGTSSYIRFLTGGGNLIGSQNAGEGSAYAVYKASGTTYLFSAYTSTDSSALAFRIDGSGHVNISDAKNVILGTTTGTKFGTSTSQKLAFYNSTPIVQPTGNVMTALTNLGLMASPTLAESDITNLVSDLALKAPLASPTFTGTVTVPTPSNSTDAANKAYVDGVATGLDVKNSVRVATTAAGTLASSFANGSTVDGVTLATGDRILIKDQSTGSENGIYTVNASGAPTRATDADSSAEVTGGLHVFVTEGTLNADTGWVLSTNDPITLGTTALTFVQFSAAGVILAGTGLTKTGNTLAIDSTVVTLAGSQTLTNKTLTSPAITNPTGIVKGDVGLGNVDNTSDATKNAAAVTLTNKTLTSPTIGDFSNATHNHTNAAGGGQLTDAALSAAVSISKGGTGQTSKAAGFDALSPFTTAGDMLYGGTAGTGTRLAAGSTTQVLIGGTTPSWGALNVGTMVTGTLAIANGGTGSSSQNFVDLSTTQTAAGQKTFSSTVNMGAEDNFIGHGSTTSGSTYWDLGSLGDTGAVWLDARGNSVTNVGIRMRTKGTGNMQFTLGTSEGMRLTTERALLIGTTSYNNNFLDVRGSIFNRGGYTNLPLGTAPAPTVTNQGTAGSTSYTYAISARSAVGETLIGTVTVTSTGNATLDATNFNRITWTAVAGAKDYRIWRTASSGTPSSTGVIGTVLGNATLSLDDTGLAASGSVPANDTSGLSGIGTSTPTAQWDIAASNTSAASFRVRSGAAPSSPNDGDGWNDSTQKALQTFLDGVKQTQLGVIFTQTANGSITNSTSETSMLGTGVGTKTLPANFFVAGKTVRLKLAGVLSTAASPGTVTLKIKLGSTVIATSTAFTPTASLTTMPFDVEIAITCRTTGASGTVVIGGAARISAGDALAPIYVSLANAGSAVTVDTTASSAFDATATFGTASASNVLTSSVATLSVEN